MAHLWDKNLQIKLYKQSYKKKRLKKLAILQKIQWKKKEFVNFTLEKMFIFKKKVQIYKNPVKFTKRIIRNTPPPPNSNKLTKQTNKKNVNFTQKILTL